MDMIINVEGLSKAFGGKPAVMDFSIQVKQGEICGFLGPNGSGKTTTIRMLCGLIKPDSGQGYCLHYRLPDEIDKIRSKVGYMTQSFSLYDYLTVYENLRFFAQVFQVKNKRQRIAFVINLLGLQKYLNFRAETLSGGWKKKLSLATALLHSPQLLLLDEPTAGVDPTSRHEFWDMIINLAKQGVTILVSTHYMDEAERCNRIAYLAYGKLMTVGSITEIVNNAGLYTWTATGENVYQLRDELSQYPSIEHISQHGNRLHICGTDQHALLTTLRPYQFSFDFQWQGKQTSIEDVFIYLMNSTQEERFA